MKLSVHLNAEILEVIRNFPGKDMWLDTDTSFGTIELSRDDKTVFHKNKGVIIYVADPEVPKSN